MSNTYLMVHYRRFEMGKKPLPSDSLESLCRKALQTTKDGSALWSRPEDRIFDVEDVDGRRIFLNKVADLSSAVFGEMCLAQNRDLQALLSMKASAVRLSNLTTATVYNLDERQAPSGSQFIRGLAYWMAIGDNLLFVKNNSMTPELIRLYLEWLLKKRTGVVSTDDGFQLNAALDKAQTSADIGEVRSFRLAGKAAPQMVMPASSKSQEREVKTSRRIGDRIAEMQQAVPIVEAIFGKKRTASLVESLGPKEYLAVEASVKVRGRRTEQSKDEFQRITNDIADSSDAKVQIEGRDGKIADGDAILRTRMPFHLPYEGSNLLEFDNVADQLQEVYSRFVKDGKIPA